MKIINLRKFNNEADLQKIIEGCLRKESPYQELLFRQFAHRIMTTCRRYETARFGAKDILQETFIAVFKNIHQFNPDKGNITTWMKRIAVNIALKELRKQKIQLVEIDHYQSLTEEESEDVMEVSEEYILAIINTLPQGYRTVFNMFVLDNFSHKEIANLLDISPQTSKSQLSKAKKMIRSKLVVSKKDNTKIYKINGK